MPTWAEALKRATRESKVDRVGPKPAPLKPARQQANCPICDKPLVGRQRSACSNRCSVALHRKRVAEGVHMRPRPQGSTEVTPESQRTRLTG
jgi:endogenous inhibitor of DNA gyrase (YacG/DUF329 family)